MCGKIMFVEINSLGEIIGFHMDSEVKTCFAYLHVAMTVKLIFQQHSSCNILLHMESPLNKQTCIADIFSHSAPLEYLTPMQS